MTELEQLKKYYAKLGETIAAMEKSAPKKWPQVGDIYYIPTMDGRVCLLHYGNNAFDDGCLSMSMAFRTDDGAEAYVEAHKTMVEFRKQPGRKKFVKGEQNWCLDINFEDNLYCAYYKNSISIANAYFESEKAALAAVAAVGEERLISAVRYFAETI